MTETSVLSQFPAADTLRNVPAMLRTMIGWMSAEQLQWRPAADRWSVAMVLTHLADVENRGFRRRVELIASEDDPFLPSYDPWDYLRRIPVFDAHAALTQFAAERARTIAFLETTPASVLSRTGRHEELGPVTFEVYLNELPFHDLGHVRQILEVYRCGAFYPKMGPYRDFYHVKP